MKTEMHTRLEQVQRASGKSYQTLADELGVSKGTIGGWITGTTAIKVFQLKLLCEAIGCTPEWAISGTVPDAEEAELLAVLRSLPDHFRRSTVDYWLKVSATSAE